MFVINQFMYMSWAHGHYSLKNDGSTVEWTMTTGMIWKLWVSEKTMPKRTGKNLEINVTKQSTENFFAHTPNNDFMPIPNDTAKK